MGAQMTEPATTVMGLPTLTRIVVGIDGTPESAQTLDVTCGLAIATGAEVIVVVAFDEAWSFERPAATIVDGAVEEDRPEAEEIARYAQRTLSDSGVTSRAVVFEGTFPQAVQAVIDTEDPDLVVVGAGQRSRAREFVFGSNAEKVVRTSPVSVLVVR
jgi:nucleotide-binding universal stress UspA family protein